MIARARPSRHRSVFEPGPPEITISSMRTQPHCLTLPSECHKITGFSDIALPSETSLQKAAGSRQPISGDDHIPTGHLSPSSAVYQLKIFRHLLRRNRRTTDIIRRPAREAALQADCLPLFLTAHLPVSWLQELLPEYPKLGIRHT